MIPKAIKRIRKRTRKMVATQTFRRCIAGATGALAVLSITSGVASIDGLAIAALAAAVAGFASYFALLNRANIARERIAHHDSLRAIRRELKSTSGGRSKGGTAKRGHMLNSSRAAFTAMRARETSRASANVNVGVILDEFSARAFGYEWNQVLLDPARWPEQLEGESLDLIFVESAWAGNGGSWQYHLAGKSAPRQPLVDMISEARRRGIPTVFWNKEDPPHYADFLKTAALFDHVFTSDGNMIPRYREDLGHEAVGTLAFAAQPAIHNPAKLPGVRRDRAAAFGGMYFRHKYPERRAQMDYLLPASAAVGLDIFSRQLGGDANYQFPAPYDTQVRGSLSYDQMLTAYHAYKIFINVNSVVDSSTMCARRVFEITASGAAVVSAPSAAIDRFFPDAEITSVEDQRTAHVAIKTLARSDEYRDRLVHRGQRRIWDHHTYAHRAQEIFAAAGIITPNPPSRRVSVIAPTMRPRQLDHLLGSVGRQVGVELELVLLLHGFDYDDRDIRRRAAANGISNITLLREPKSTPFGECLNRMVSASTGAYITKMDDDDLYGPHYLHDLLNAQMFSGAGLVGKSAAYCYFAERDTTVLLAGSKEHSFGTFVRGSTLFGPRATFESTPFQALARSEDTAFLSDYLSTGGQIYAADRFNYVIYRAGDQSDHTWTVSDAELFSSGEVKFFGSPEASIFI